MKSMYSQPQSQSGGNATGLVAGAAMRITTPNPLLPVSGGLGPTAPVKGKRGEIGVRVLYLKQGTTGLAFVGIDALGFPAVLGDRIRAKVKAATPATSSGWTRSVLWQRMPLMKPSTKPNQHR